MNALEVLAGLDWWQLAGWTMLHYLWAGALVGVVAAVLRFAVRRASAQVRYAVALGALVALAVLPLGISLGVRDRVSGVRDNSDEYSTEAGGDLQTNDATEAQMIALASEISPPAPGSAGGIVELKRRGRPVETALVDGLAPLQITNPDSNPRQSRGLAGEYLWQSVIEFSAKYLPWVWIVGAPLVMVLLVTGVVGAERLRRESHVLREGPIAEAAARLAESLRIGRRVTVAVCERIAAPVLVGIVRPMILLPPAVLTGWSPDEIEMVLLHELAHVRRWDNLVNLVQRFVEAVLFFQPAVWLVSGWVRREREACCDAVVVGRTQRPQAYAELLVALASQLPRSVLFHPAATSAMAAGPLRGRIRHILGMEDDPMLISGKSLGVVMGSMLLAATLVVLNLTTSTQAEAETLTTEGTESTEKKLEVPFVVGASKFADGDSIAITKVEGTADEFEAGGTYWIEGTYKLASRKQATLGASVTASTPVTTITPHDPDQSVNITRQIGEFKLKLTMHRDGSPHVSFYPADGGQSFGGVYFGTGNSVLNESQVGLLPSEVVEDSTDIAEQRAGTQNNLKNLALAILNFESAHKSFPAHANLDAEGKPLLSWRVMILPYLGDEEAKLFAEFRPDEPWDGEHNRKLIARMPKVFQNPQIDKPGMTNYLAVVGEECVFDGSGQGIRLAKILDGTSRTIAIVEADADRAVEWTKPADWEFDRERPTAGLGGLWPDHWYAAWVDGSIRSVANGESADEVGIQFTRAGGEKESLAESAGMAGGMMGMGMEGGMDAGMGMGGEMMGGRGVEMGMAATSATATPVKKFPTLEEQKLADVVYRQLGLELEPLTGDDLQRVKALGFEGGMKVSINDNSVISRGGIVPNDILVGLHVWPTKSAADVVQVLGRDDLGELNPLKFYLVRRVGEPNPFAEMGEDNAQLRDEVVTGRISVLIPAKKQPAQEFSDPWSAIDKEANVSRPRPASTPRGATSTSARPKPTPRDEPIPIPPLTNAEKAELLKGGPFLLECRTLSPAATRRS
jgi:beta-lactamase regulating signal transducer with metallopeptidase domain